MNRNSEDYSEFKKEFWEWFDRLPKGKKMMFWYYKEDISETNFYFTVYAKKK